MIVLAAILIASPVLAAGSSNTMEMYQVGKKWKKPTIISLTGEIKEVRGSEIDVAIQMTNKAFREYRLTKQTIDITDALCLEWTNKGKSESFDCAQLDKPDTVAIIAKVDRTDPENVTFTARRVQKKQPRIRIPEP